MTTSPYSFWDFLTTDIYDLFATRVWEDREMKSEKYPLLSPFIDEGFWLGNFSERSIPKSSEEIYHKYSPWEASAKICRSIREGVLCSYRRDFRRIDRSYRSRENIKTSWRMNPTYPSWASTWGRIRHGRWNWYRWARSRVDGISNPQEPLLCRRGSQCGWIYGRIFSSNMLGEWVLRGKIDQSKTYRWKSEITHKGISG